MWQRNLKNSVIGTAKRTKTKNGIGGFYQMKNVILLTGAGQIGMAIARRMGYGMKILVGDKTGTG